METILRSLLDASPLGIVFAIITAAILFFVSKRKKIPVRRLEDLPLKTQITARKFNKGNMIFQLSSDYKKNSGSKQIENGFYLDGYPFIPRENREYRVVLKTLPKRTEIYRDLELA